MLDNLKLGYGGTATEMARLINDSGVLGDKMIDLGDKQNIGAALAEVGFDKMVEAIHKVQDEMGITGTTALEAEKTISGSFNSMKGAWENFMVALVDSEQDAGEAFNELWASAQTFLGNLAPKIGEVIKSMGAFGVVLMSVSAALVTFKVVNTIVKGLNALKVATESTTIAQALLNKVMNMNPFVLIATLIAGVVTALITLWNTSEGFREAVQEIWEAITSFFGTAWETIVGFFSGAGEFFAGVWQIIKAPFVGVIEFFSNIFSGAWKAIKNVFSIATIGNFFGGIWSTIVGTFKTIGTKVADAIGGAFKSAINSVIWVVEGAINLIPKAINGAIHLINKLPGVEISKIPLVKLPRLERGGVLKRGQVGLLEGNGAEAVVPLEKNTGWIKKIAEELNRNMMNTTKASPVKVVVGIDENTNYMGLARSLLPLLKVAEKEAYA